MVTQLDQAGIDLMIHFEGCILHAYHDQVGISTIGIGMTYYPQTGIAVTMQDPPISQTVANADFLLMAKPYANTVHFTTKPVLTQNQFNALFSLCYNIGIGGFKGSHVLRIINGEIGDLEAAWMAWDTAKGRVISDLRDRRQAEYNLYVS